MHHLENCLYQTGYDTLSGMLNISMARVLAFCLITATLVLVREDFFPRNCHAALNLIQGISASNEIPKQPVKQVQGKVRDDKRVIRGEITVLEDGKYFKALLNRINSAKRDVLISMYIFKTTGKRTNAADRIKDALIKAARRGVDVKVLLEREDAVGSSINSENKATAAGLARGGVKVYFDSPRKRTHVKAVVIDGRYTFIGSHNLTASALQHNRELSLLIDSEEVARETARYIEEMIPLKSP